MEPTGRPRPGTVIGIGLVVIGAIALALRWGGVNLSFDVGDAWPIFVVAPGLVLLGASLFVTPPRGLPFAVAGSVITATGLLLWVQQATDRYDTWAYAWAIVAPGAVGIGTLLYGLFTRARHLIEQGALVTVIGAALFAVGAWYFEPILTEGREPIEWDTAWPILVIVAGAVIAAMSFFRPSRHAPQG